MADDHVVIITLYHPGFGDISASQYDFLGKREQAFEYGNTLAEEKRLELGCDKGIDACSLITGRLDIGRMFALCSHDGRQRSEPSAKAQQPPRHAQRLAAAGDL